MLSNALSILADAVAGAPATRPAAPATTFGSMEQTVAAIGVCVLVVCIVRRVTRPAKLALNNTPGRSNTINPIHVIAVFALWQGAAAGALHVLATYFPNSLGGPDPDKQGVLASGIGFAFMLAASVLVAAGTFRSGLRRGLGLSLRHWIYDTGRGVIGYLAVIPVCWGLLMAMRAILILPPEQIENHQMLTAVAKMDGIWRVLVIFSAVILVPLTEEIFFRGLLQSMLRKYLGHAWVAILITSVLFAVGHARYHDTIPALFVLAVVLGYNYERSGRLYPSILMHMIFNGVAILAALLRAG